VIDAAADAREREFVERVSRKLAELAASGDDGVWRARMLLATVVTAAPLVVAMSTGAEIGPLPKAGKMTVATDDQVLVIEIAPREYVVLAGPVTFPA
jgi:hypothetical protein